MHLLPTLFRIFFWQLIGTVEEVLKLIDGWNEIPEMLSSKDDKIKSAIAKHTSRLSEPDADADDSDPFRLPVQVSTSCFLFFPKGWVPSWFPALRLQSLLALQSLRSLYMKKSKLPKEFIKKFL